MLLESIAKELEDIISSCGCTLYDIALVKEQGTQILRISIMKQGGVSLEDCAFVSEFISPLLDVKDVLRDSYMLEVSSPGVERVLKDVRHFMLSCGEAVRLRLEDKSEITAMLMQASDEGIWISALEDAPCSALEAISIYVGTANANNTAHVANTTEHANNIHNTTHAIFIPYAAIKRAKTMLLWDK